MALDTDMQRPAEAIVESAGSSFTAGMRLLPKDRRRAIFAIYAFCRAVDDIADGDGTGPDKALRLDAWQRELDRARAGHAATPVGAELSWAIGHYDLPEEELELIIEGMRMDVDGMVAPERPTLDAYVRRVAGSVGLLSMHIFGAWRGESSRRFALSLARALQLTNILRDIEEDAAMGRVYLPRDLLAEAGAAADPALVADDPHLPQVRARLAREARAAFTEAEAEIAAHPRLRLMPALLMMGPYERILRQIERDPTRRPPDRGQLGKVWDGARCLARGRR
ncbi:squalene/phytoene synthase family protein [Pseudoroseicyclus tamaricis]|uniref:Squalene/phytoene synthase family protein n=1 Tax=Pseudoroseicyclus tamaricis TaxID=2705421 RepID=A0A6B2JLI6_9RHOB|nr:squalene/phytoene synthase family protein [Pseudoroseicyclus tamaricis]NDV02421.1 squalene/phytoene synthase family protein [Pseudoroseicyclus tamaricis]